MKKEIGVHPRLWKLAQLNQHSVEHHNKDFDQKRTYSFKAPKLYHLIGTVTMLYAWSVLVESTYTGSMERAEKVSHRWINENLKWQKNEWMWVISPIGEKVEWVHSMTWIEFKFEIQKLLLNDIHWKVRECSGWKNVTITTKIRTLYGSVYNNEIYYFLSWLCFHFMTKLTEIVFILFVFVEYPDSQLLMNIESINLQFRNVILLSNFMLTNRACTLLKKAPDI